jgi:hypothetical protein
MESSMVLELIKAIIIYNHLYTSVNVTKLDFVELLLKEAADPNAQDHLGVTPLMCTTRNAPGSAKFRLNWLAYHGRQYYRSIWSVLPSQGS